MSIVQILVNNLSAYRYSNLFADLHFICACIGGQISYPAKFVMILT